MSDEEKDRLVKDVVRILLYLYSVIIALALTKSIGLTVAPNEIALSPLELRMEDLALFGSLFITIVPFYHGASVYMLATYKKPSGKKGSILVDFFALSFEGVIFYAMATSIHSLNSFMIWFISLLMVDVVWCGFTYFTQQEPKKPAPKEWAILNSITSLILIALSAVSSTAIVQIYPVLFSVAAARTVLDYAFCYSYYFPSESS